MYNRDEKICLIYSFCVVQYSLNNGVHFFVSVAKIRKD